jgi:hypothetical protein
MDYGDDDCLERFSAEQVRRMRCTLESYRSMLFQTGGAATPTASQTPLGPVGVPAQHPPVAGFALLLLAAALLSRGRRRVGLVR